MKTLKHSSTADLMKRLLKAASSNATGSIGKSAYDIAVDNGFIGTEQEWLESLRSTTDLGIDGGRANEVHESIIGIDGGGAV